MFFYEEERVRNFKLVLCHMPLYYMRRVEPFLKKIQFIEVETEPEFLKNKVNLKT